MKFGGFAVVPLCLTLVLGFSRPVLRAEAIDFAEAKVTLCGKAAPPSSASVCGFSLVAAGGGPQVAVMKPANVFLAAVRGDEEVTVTVTAPALTGPFLVTAEVTLVDGQTAEADISAGGAKATSATLLGENKTLQLQLSGRGSPSGLTMHFGTRGRSADAAVRWRNIRLKIGDRSVEVPVSVAAIKDGPHAAPVLPSLRKPIEEALIGWDWRMQDGIGTQRVPSTYAAATERTLRRGDRLIRDLQAAGATLGDHPTRWQALWREWKELSSAQKADSSRSEDLWRRVHHLRRQIVFSNPLAGFGPLLFVKEAPGSFSHELTQYVGRFARPGGGVFVLDAPGESMQCRQLAAGELPQGSYQHPAVSYAGDRVLFSFCPVDTPPPKGIDGDRGRHFHLYEMAADGSRLRRLTDGPFDDFSPRYLPAGKIVFVSTRRGGWHRCGGSPGHGCENYTLAVAEADGSHAHPISFHETQEWDPAVLHSGHVIFTRWDYVDRHAVYYEQLWTTRPDGSNPAIFFGNNTFNPVGIWEAQPVPGSQRVMATAGAHHAMTAGSIILVDVNRGVDGLQAITRLTPDALFPESETSMLPRGWHAAAGIHKPPAVPPEQKRWPGHCYKSPYPLSESYFLAAYSFDPLIGEPGANAANMFGVYLVDRFGNKELLYRDLNIGSLWPVPLRARRRPALVRPVDPGVVAGVESSESRVQSPKPDSSGARSTVASELPEGMFFVQNVYEADPPLPVGSIKRLRIVQVLPKSTPGINWPRVGLPNASPGKQVVGTVPVEPDGSAYFRAPAGIPLSFQALDARGQAVQIMRSITYLQPGEVVSCTGCHERRIIAPPASRLPLASLRPPSTIQPGPDGSNPLNYAILVQPLLDKRCVSCHSRKKPDGGVVLTGEPEGAFTVSYNALAPRVTYSAWGGRKGDFRQVNSEPLSKPGHFGALGSSLMKLLLKGHEKVVLSDEEIERLATWMDANALFYGTFNRDDQARQRRGERISGPDFQ